MAHSMGLTQVLLLRGGPRAMGWTFAVICIIFLVHFLLLHCPHNLVVSIWRFVVWTGPVVAVMQLVIGAQHTCSNKHRRIVSSRGAGGQNLKALAFPSPSHANFRMCWCQGAGSW